METHIVSYSVIFFNVVLFCWVFNFKTHYKQNNEEKFKLSLKSKTYRFFSQIFLLDTNKKWIITPHFDPYDDEHMNVAMLNGKHLSRVTKEK